MHSNWKTFWGGLGRFFIFGAASEIFKLRNVVGDGFNLDTPKKDVRGGDVDAGVCAKKNVTGPPISTCWEPLPTQTRVEGEPFETDV